MTVVNFKKFPEMKVCTKCKVNKPFSEYHINKERLINMQPRCKDCRNKVSREAYKNNPKVRRSGLKNRPDKVLKLYGITYEEVLRTYDKQQGLCANISCCKEISLDVPKGKNRAVIDHNHKTGKFRALLCTQCNLTLGYLEKQPKIILGLQEYLIKHLNKGK